MGPTMFFVAKLFSCLSLFVNGKFYWNSISTFVNIT